MKKNSGFTLVELIVVIVIVAILIGVSITGIYTYIKQSKINADMNNCKTIKETIQNIEDDADCYRRLVRATVPNSKTVLTYECDKASSSTIHFEYSPKPDADANDELQQALDTYAKRVYLRGLPAPKSKGRYILAIGIEKNENRQITIKVDCILVSKKNIIKYSDDESRIGQELTDTVLVW